MSNIMLCHLLTQSGEGWSNSTVGRTLVLHEANSSSIPCTPYGSLSPPEMISEPDKARSKPWVPPGISPPTPQKKLIRQVFL